MSSLIDPICGGQQRKPSKRCRYFTNNCCEEFSDPLAERNRNQIFDQLTHDQLTFCGGRNRDNKLRDLRSDSEKQPQTATKIRSP